MYCKLHFNLSKFEQLLVPVHQYHYQPCVILDKSTSPLHCLEQMLDHNDQVLGQLQLGQ